MLVGLISDTHIPNNAKELPSQLKEVFHGVSLILHAGDVYVPSVLDELELIAPVLASTGDDDTIATRYDKRVKGYQVITLEGVTIYLAHDTSLTLTPQGTPRTMNPQHTGTPDVIVFGHSHKTTLERKGGVLLVNPGSATFPHYKREPGTVGLLELNSGKAEAKIIQLQ